VSNTLSGLRLRPTMIVATTRKQMAPAWGHVTTARHSGKHQVWLPTHHFERLLKEACPNHTYPVKHKLKECDMIKNFMISVSLTRGMELDEDPGISDMTPFPMEDAVMMVYDGCPPPGRRHMSSLSPETLPRHGWEPRNTGV
jgi:hypothetical protein